MRARVEILSECEVRNGWSFEARWRKDAAGATTRQTVQLSWADYNHWSRDGSDPPQRVAEAVLRFMLMRLEPDAVPARFDASIARRRFDDADIEIPKLIRRE